MKGSCIRGSTEGYPQEDPWRARGGGSLHTLEPAVTGYGSATRVVGVHVLTHWPVPTHAGRKTSSMLEVDDEGGRMFLRVLLHLTMHDYPPLVSGALQLLFKHFSQRQEAMHTFKQVKGGHQPSHEHGACLELWGTQGSSCSQIDNRDVCWSSVHLVHRGEEWGGI